MNRKWRLRFDRGIWRNLWEDSYDLGGHVLTYTRAQLKTAQKASKQAERSRLP